MAKATPKTRALTKAKRRAEWERRVWSALLEYVNTGSGFENLVSEGLDWIAGDIDDLQVCKDIRAGATLESLAATYREPMRALVTWLAAPEDRRVAGKALAFLMEHGNTITMHWSTGDYNLKDPDSSLVSEWPDRIGSVVAPVCRFVRDMIDKHDLEGEPLKTAIPIALCDRKGCGRFRIVKLSRQSEHVFCSNLCKSTYHQNVKGKEANAAYMRERRAVLDRNKPKGTRAGRTNRAKAAVKLAGKGRG
jgi:hypothetical protein